MPELPEVETVRAGLERHVLGREILRVDAPSARAVRRMPGGAAQLRSGLTGAAFESAQRRGKFLWLPLRSSGTALLVHLGMSGQLLVRSAADIHADPEPHRHLRARVGFADGGALDFVDQRTFGYLAVEELRVADDGDRSGSRASGSLVPVSVAHIARDLLDPGLDRDALVGAFRARRTAVKRALLDQTLVSGVGNIYADEALWRARVHPERASSSLSRAKVGEVLEAAAAVMREALAQGGTSFDALYVNVNGASGYFDRSLAVYGQEGRECPRCGGPIRRIAFANRSSHYCPRCQRRT